MSMDLDSASTSTSSAGTVIPTPAASDTSRRSSNTQPVPMPIPSGPLLATSLSVNSWRTPYPVIGQFAEANNEVVAATSQGLVFFKRLQDHPSKPWTEPQPFPSAPTGMLLDNYSVSGLCLFSDKKCKCLNVYCVSEGVMHAFYRFEEEGVLFSPDPCPPLQNHLVSGTPTVARIHDSPDRWCVVVPCQSGGLLYTLTTSRPASTSYGGTKRVSNQVWMTAEHVAKDLGIISAVSVITTRQAINVGYNTNYKIDLVAVLIASGRLHVVEGPYGEASNRGYYAPTSGNKWEMKASTMIHHPGEVTGNPTVMSHMKNSGKCQLDLLVPSAEGGVFHFIRAASSQDEWHMIGRIKFPQGIPLATCLTCTREDGNGYSTGPGFRGLIQSGGRLFQTRTWEGIEPWDGCTLQPILGPGPFEDGSI